MTDEGPLRRCILLAEDSAIIGLELADTLACEGFAVAGPFTTCAAAEAWLHAHEPAAAILDNTLKDGPCERLAADLKRRGIPFVVYSGHDRHAGQPAVFQGAPWVTKPAPSEALLGVMRRCMDAHGARRADG